MKVVEVAVGVIIKQDRVFITRRAEHLHQGGKWEFPGGKKEQGETIQDALSRELKEEVGIDVTRQTSLMLIEHTYPEKRVALDVRIVDEFSGEPKGMEGQEGQWVPVSELDQYTFPDANGVIVEKLQGRYS